MTSGAQTLTVKQTPGGTSYLTDSSGKTLYLFEGRLHRQVELQPGQCAAGVATADGQRHARQPGVNRDDDHVSAARTAGKQGRAQTGHPLYYFIMDTAAGDTKGEGLNAFGGLLVRWSAHPATRSRPVK